MPYQQPDICIMYDIESLDTGPRSVVSQIGFQAFPADDPDKVLSKAVVYLPLQPQIELKRTVSAATIAWWMKQDDAARSRFEMSTGDEFEELPALLRFIARKFSEVTAEGTKSYELWAKGPQFDITNIETLMQETGVRVPWRYDRVRDLRTLMALAGIRTEDVPRPESMTAHMADEDARYQILCYSEALSRLSARH